MKQSYITKLALLLIVLSGLNLRTIAQTSTYTTAGGPYAFNVPVGVTSIKIDASGAQGGSSLFGESGGLGGAVICTLAVTGGTSLNVFVGGQGANAAFGPTPGGINGGGQGYGYSGGGGGSSDVRVGGAGVGNRVMATGGGGGGGNSCGYGDVGGAGGGLSGGNGLSCGDFYSGECGGGATPGGGGSGAFYAGAPGGSPLNGGGNNGYSYSGGGGGGGWFGGGAGYYGGGGGGSSYYGGTGVTGGSTSTGVRTGSGQVIITILCNNPGTISSPGTVCMGSTTTMTSVGAGVTGTWSSSNPSAASINASTGFVTTVAPGTTTITYNVPTPCGSLATTVLTVNPVPGPISGIPNVCVGSFTTLSNIAGGGSWSSGNPSLASVNSSSGVVTGLAAGSLTISYALPTGCTIATLPFTVNPQPLPITGPTSVCGSQTITLSDGTGGGSWISSNTVLATVGSTGVVTGAGAGNPTITYSLPSGCRSLYAITVNPLAAIAGSPSMCLGNSTSLTDAVTGGTWSSSNSAVATVGSSSGVVTSVSVGTTVVSYSVPGGCVATLPAFVTSTPSVFSVTGGGSYCTGGTGVTIGISGSNAGVSYQLVNGALPVGFAIIGSGLGFSFGLQTAAGTYGIIADPGTSCATTMSGSAVVNVQSLPTPFTVSGGGSYCTGGTGVHVLLNSSAIGVNYQLFVTTLSGTVPVGALVPGTSGALDFGVFTTAGTYTVVGTNVSTGCIGNMSGSAVISINTLPTANTVTINGVVATSGSYCTGGAGISIGLNGSVLGNSYQLMYSGSPIGAPVAGSGSSFSFGTFFLAGLYTVAATNGSGCTANMTGSATISINALPTVFSVTGGGNYCVGGAGVPVGLNGSSTGVSYQLYVTTGSTTAIGLPVLGTGASISFGSQTTTGSYTVVATTASGCISNMFGSVAVATNPLPSPFSVGGGGTICAGATGVSITLSSSAVGTTYSLLNGATVVGGATGNGLPINFGLFSGAGTYTVSGVITATGCTANMSGSANIIVNPLPAPQTITVTGIPSGTGTYCAGGAGVAVGQNGSQSGVSYQLYNSGTAVGAAVSGSGLGISFGSRPAGVYTVIATSGAGCSANMTGIGTVIATPLPTVYSVTGGGSYCVGGTGVHIGLTSTDAGINYQLLNGVNPVGSAIGGFGAALDYGLITTVSSPSYTIVATNATTGCSSNMFGAVTVTVNPLPTVFTMGSSGSFCNGGSGFPVVLNNSTLAVSYQLMRGGSPVGSPMIGTGSALNFGFQTVAGTYNIVATSPAGCTNTMAGSTTITINPLPTVYLVTGGGNYCAGGTGVHIFLNASAIGTNYQLYNGFTPVGLSVVGTGGALDFGLITTPGISYNVVATNAATGCTNNMSGTVGVFINSAPPLYAVTGGGNYCTGGTGLHVGLAGSNVGVNYQLLLGAAPVGAPLAGNGFALDFGLQTGSGTYTVLATNAVLGCTAYMVGSVAVVTSPLPAPHTLTGGGNYCPSGAGVAIGLDGSNSDVSYQLYLGAVPVGAPVPGSDSTITFGLQTGTGVYSVVATNLVTTCTSTMAGTETIGLYTLPLVYNVTGGGNYCPAGTGVHVGLDGTNIGNTYQLYNGVSPVGSAAIGTGLPIDFGLETAVGTYTVKAMSTATGCVNPMGGSANVNISALPAQFNVTGGGDYCAGTSGRTIGTDGSEMFTTYQLYRGVFPIGSSVAGTGGPLNFGLQTTIGTYTVHATSSATTCTNNMANSVTIVIDPLPNVYSVTGGGNYCSGGTGVAIGLSSSQTGVYYQLSNGVTPMGAPVAGTGTAITFGPQTMAGVYTVQAMTSSTSCTSNMTGSVIINVNSLPTAYDVTGGGNYCPLGAGVHVGLSGSNTGVSYQMFKDLAIFGAPILGTGSAIDFGMQTGTGSYTIAATNTTTGCTSNMTGSASVGISSLPNPFTLVSPISNYCVGGSGVDLTLTGSEVGINYQLYQGGIPTGAPVAGTGFGLNFGLQTLPATYTVIASSASTTCSRNMPGTVTVAIIPLPTAFTVIGGGSYCDGGTGVNIGLSNSQVGISYQLYHGLATVGAAVMGTGFPISFGAQTQAGAYTAVATNPVTTCTNVMSGGASVSVDPLPTMYTVTGGGNYCATGAGVHIGLTGSNTVISYQLFNGVAAVGGPALGTGGAIDFGLQTAAGNYTVTATNSSTGCINSMSGSATVGVNSLPVAYVVSGGGNYCPGGDGFHISTAGSDLGIAYQLYNGTLAVGAPMAGTGSGIDFGLKTDAGTYTVVATNASTGCKSNMSGSASIGINTLPASFNVVGGGNYCAGGTGVHIGLDGSTADISYQLFRGATPVGIVTGTGGPIDFGMQSTAGAYRVVATNTATGCTANMSGTATVVVNLLIAPSVTLSTGIGDTVCAGNLVSINALVSGQGTAPVYHWTLNGLTVAAAGTNYNYIPTDGDVVTLTMTSNAACATPATVSNTLNLTVLAHGTPGITITADPANGICQGTVVNYTSATTYGGTAPAYSWVVNGINQGADPSYSYVPGNGDVVYCVLTSNYQCRLANTGASNHITMNVDVPVVPDVTVTAHPGTNVIKGQTVLLSATLNNDVVAPSYQWFINGSPAAGQTMATFSGNNFSDGDSISCAVTSGGSCAGNVGSGWTVLHVETNVGVTPIVTGNSDLVLVPNPNKGIFTIKGTLGTTNDQEVSLEVTDMLGQVIYKGSVVAHGGNINETIKLNNVIANGMYLLNLHSGAENKVFHIVVEQ